MTSKNILKYNWQPYFFYFAFAKAILILTSCSNNTVSLEKITGSKIAIDTTITGDSEIQEMIEPYKSRVEAEMNEPLCYNPKSMHKNDTPLNTAIGNMMADIVMEQGNPIFKSRTGNDIDVVLLNHGGIRAPMNKGTVTTRTAYQIMPFENEIVVATLNKSQLEQLIEYLTSRERAHPFSGMKIKLQKDQKPEVEIADKDVYYVATSDYLHNNGDNMRFFKDTPATSLNYKVRNAMIDYFKKVDTLNFKADNRFTRVE